MRQTTIALTVTLLLLVAAATSSAAVPTLTLVGPPDSGAGFAVANVGDVNGDGLPDVAVGAPFRSLSGRPNAGTVYVVFGGAARGSLTLEALGASGFCVVGAHNDRAGYAVTAAGDVNGDGRADILLSAPRKYGYKVAGAAYVVYGKGDQAPVDLAHLGLDQGFEIAGTAPNPVATSEDIAGPGDVDGDGFADVAVTAAGNSGAAVIYGAARRARVDLRHLGTRGARIVGARLPSVAAAGDVDGDGRLDVALGAQGVKLPGHRFETNTAFVVSGRRARATIDLRRLGTRGMRVGGLVSGRVVRPSIVGVGDLNGDRRSDLLVVRDPAGAPGQRPLATVVFGARARATVDASRLGARGFTLLGPAPAAGGFSTLGPVAALGDLNGDGIPDFGLSSFTAQAQLDNPAHAAYIVSGRTSRRPLLLSAVSSHLVADAGDCQTLAGAAVAPAGDFDRDGKPDLLVGGPAYACAARALVVPAP